MEILFFENHAENVTGRLVPDLPLFFKKDSCEVKASSQHLDNWTLRNRLGHIIKAKFITFQNDDPAICSILIFIKGIKTRFFKKNVSYLYSTNRINFIVWLLLLHEKLHHNIRIAIVSIPVCDVTNFETFVFSSSHFLHNQKSQDNSYLNRKYFNRKQNIVEKEGLQLSFFEYVTLCKISLLYCFNL